MWKISSKALSSSVAMDTSVGFMMNSFVFLDLETSHLYSSDRPTIIEMSLFAIHRTGLLHPDILTSTIHAKKEDGAYNLSKVAFPRVVDKLTLCLDPRKHTSPATFCLTKLDNLNLGESKKMSLDEDVITMLRIFLSRQEAPVCLVAHNGNRFDFPMLRTELSRLTADEPFKDIYCADSWEGFRDDFRMEGGNIPDTEPMSLKRKLVYHEMSTQGASALGETCPAQKKSVGLSLAEGSASANGMASSSSAMPNTVGSEQVSTVSSSESANQSSTLASNLLPPISNEAGVSNNQSILSNDPLHLQTSTSDNLPCTSSHTPPQQVLSKRPSPPPPPRKIPPQYRQIEDTSKKISYSLINIFKRTFGNEPPNSHSAEDDVVSLIKVILPRVEEFVNWANMRATQYKNVGLYYKPLKPRRRLFNE